MKNKPINIKEIKQDGIKRTKKRIRDNIEGLFNYTDYKKETSDLLFIEMHEPGGLDGFLRRLY